MEKKIHEGDVAEVRRLELIYILVETYGGLTLLCGSQRQSLGLLMACGGLLQGWECQDRKRINDNDRVRDPKRNGEEGSNNQVKIQSGGGAGSVEEVGVTGTPPPEVKKLVEVKEEKMIKTRQDPKDPWEPQSGEGTTNPKGKGPLVKGARRESSQNDQKKGKVAVGGQRPGIRAFRKGFRGSEGSEPQAHNRRKGARARGVDGMVQMDRGTLNFEHGNWKRGSRSDGRVERCSSLSRTVGRGVTTWWRKVEALHARRALLLEKERRKVLKEVSRWR